MPEPVYRTSSFCSGGDCLAVALTPGTVLVRDTKDRSRPPAEISASAWTSFLTGMKAGEFDL